MLDQVFAQYATIVADRQARRIVRRFMRYAVVTPINDNRAGLVA